jgi:hypothetical protein
MKFKWKKRKNIKAAALKLIDFTLHYLDMMILREKYIS